MSVARVQVQPALNVFIGHSHEDQPLVDRIVRSLTFGGRVRVLSDRTLRLGDHWPSALRREIETSDVFIVIGSPASAKSEWVLQELGGAWALGKPIIVVTPEGEVEWAPPIEPSAYKRVALSDLEQPTFAERLLAELTHSPQDPGH